MYYGPRSLCWLLHRAASHRAITAPRCYNTTVTNSAGKAGVPEPDEISIYGVRGSTVRLARFLGFLTHPVLVVGPVIAAIGYHEVGRASISPLILGFSAFLGTVGVPALILIAAMKAGLMRTDVFFHNRNTRYFVYPAILAGLVVDLVLFGTVVDFQVGRAIAWSGIVCTVGLFGLNAMTKVSFHGASAACLFMLGLCLYGKEALLLLPLIPVVVWARVVAANHSIEQALLGLAVGALSVLLVVPVGYPELNKMTGAHIRQFSDNPIEYWLPFSGRPKAPKP